MADFKPLADMELQEMLQEYAAIDTEFGVFMKRHAALAKAVKSTVLDTGEIADGVTIGRPYTRRSWDSKGLTGYAVANPEILQFAKDTEVTVVKINAGEVKTAA